MFLQLLAQSSNGAGAAGAGAVGAIFILGIILVIAASIFWLWMLIDCLTSSLPTPEKILWFCVIFFLHLIGAIIYFFVARRGNRLLT